MKLRLEIWEFLKMLSVQSAKGAAYAPCETPFNQSSKSYTLHSETRERGKYALCRAEAKQKTGSKHGQNSLPEPFTTCTSPKP